jgi:hypothetical protein
VEKPSIVAITAAAYAVLVMLGLLMGVLGGFQHSWYLRPVPVAAICWAAALFAVCYGAGRMMSGKLAALAPTVGWMVITMIWLASRPEGDVIIANDLSGYVYLYGSLAGALMGVLLSPSASGGSWLLTQRSYRTRPVEPHSL